MRPHRTSTAWQLGARAAELYQKVLVPSILGPAARTLVELARPSAGTSILDVGCGTGAASRAAATLVGPAGHVVGVDINAGMLAIARSQPADTKCTIERREEDASSLTFGDESFDLVLSAQTLQFLPDKSRALGEMLRVIQPGGRLALSIWCTIKHSPYFHALVESMTTHVGPGVARGLEAAFGLSDSNQIVGLLDETGFSDIQIAEVAIEVDLRPMREFVPEHVGATPMSVGYNAASVEQRDAVVLAMEDAMAEFSSGAGIRVPFVTHVVTASRA